MVLVAKIDKVQNVLKVPTIDIGQSTVVKVTKIDKGQSSCPSN